MKKLFVYITFSVFLGLCSLELYQQHMQNNSDATQGILIRFLKKDKEPNPNTNKKEVQTPEELDYESLFSSHD